MDSPLGEPFYESEIFFNQDTVRDNFSAITILIDQVFEGIGLPGGAVVNLFINAPDCQNIILTEALKKGVITNSKTSALA